MNLRIAALLNHPKYSDLKQGFQIFILTTFADPESFVRGGGGGDGASSTVNVFFVYFL